MLDPLTLKIVGALLLVGLVVWAWMTIPPEPRENVEARERYGTVSDGGINHEPQQDQ